MPEYKNGYIPDELLITFETGHNSTDGDWKHQLSPGTYAKHLALVARAKKRTNGRTLRPSEGWSCYRPYFAQVYIRKIKGKGAAWPGSSSHGGFWENHQTLAIDYGNWESVYAGFGGLNAFVEDCRAVGLTPLQIIPARGYPYEPWHVIDNDPWAQAPADIGSTPFEEDDMFTDEDRTRLDAVYAGMFGPANVGATTPLGWKNLDGSAGSANYGILPIEIYTQQLVAAAAGQVAGLAAALSQLKGGGSIDQGAVEAAAERGARDAIATLTLKAQ